MNQSRSIGTNNLAANQAYRQPGDSGQVYNGALYSPISYERSDMPLLPQLLPFGASPNAVGAVNRWLAAQDRTRTEFPSSTRRPAGPATSHPPVRIIVLGNAMATDIYPRLIPESSPWFTAATAAPQHRTTLPAQQDSLLTLEEQNASLKKLRREIYNPAAKKIMQRVSLYYRDNSGKNNSSEKEKESVDDEDGKSCAICLEEFEPRQIVMLTPCNHMFHEDCIVPWAKSHGKCPVCRFSMCDRLRDRAVASNSASDPSSGDLMSIIRAMELAYIE